MSEQEQLAVSRRADTPAWVLALGRVGHALGGLFALGVGLAVAACVALLLALLDGAGLRTALTAGAIALVPAGAMAWLTLYVARTLARSPTQRQVLALGEEDRVGVASRRDFQRLAEREWFRCRRYGDSGALLHIEVDHLDRVHANLGARCAEAVEQEVARRVESTLRQSDILGRANGAHLAVFLAHTDPLGALDAAERIRQQVAGGGMQWESTQVLATVSVGVAHVHLGQATLDGLLADAGAALTAATEAGRNCVRATPIEPRPTDNTRSTCA